MRRKIKDLADACLRLMRGILLFAFDTAVLLVNRRKTSRTAGAIFCLHGWGDLLLAGHAVTQLAALLQSRRLKAVLFVHPAHVEFARRYFEVDEVEGIDRHYFTRSFSYRSKVINLIAGRFAVTFQPTYNRMLRVEDALMRATGAGERIGCAGHAPFILPVERKLGDRVYTRLIRAQTMPMHELERYAEFMTGLGITLSTQPWRIAHRDPPDGAIKSPECSYLVVSTEASDRRRSWPVENFLRVAQKVASEYSCAVVLIGDKKNQSDIAWPESSMRQPELFDLRGQTSACDLVGLISGAILVIANDSGVYHLGISLNRPTVAVGGSGLPARYFPYPHESSLPTKMVFQPVPCAGCNWRCIHTRTRFETAWCIQQITWPELGVAASQLLKSEIRA